MKYRNVQTGEVREFTCTLSGKQWEPIKKAPISVEEISDNKPVKKSKSK